MHIWIVELQIEGKWYSTDNCALTRKEGREELYRQQKYYSNNKCRLRKYVREEKEA